MTLKLSKEHSIRAKGLSTQLYPESIISEQFRTIRTNFQFLNNGKKNQSILITSPSNGEGKSIMVANLAISLAQLKEKVLLIDTNLKDPTLHTIFNVNDTVGLTNVLNGSKNLEDTIIQTEIGRIDLLPCGPTAINSYELIGSEVMFELITDSLKKYNVVLIDSPSFLEFSYTNILASMCDGLILVIKSGKTDKKKALEVKRSLDIAKANVIGAIINDKK